jgi:hypothetical protein
VSLGGGTRTRWGEEMRTSIAFRVVAALALSMGLAAGGAAVAYATGEGDDGCVDIAVPDSCSVPDVPDLPVTVPDPVESSPAPESPAPTEPAAPAEEPAEPETGGTPATGGGDESGATTGGSTTTPAQPAEPAQQPAAPAAGPGSSSSSNSSSGSASAGSSSSGKSTASGTSTSSSSVPETVTAAPAVPVAPQGPVLTQVQSKAATRALEEARQTLPTTVEPNTRLLAGNTSSNGSLMPSPDDSGLLALIVAMAVASGGCAATAVVLRKRSRPRHIARPSRG